MGAAIVLGDYFDVFVPVASVKLVLDAEVGEMNAVVEVRQVVRVSPALDLARIAIGSPVAVCPSAVRGLQPFLVFALELGVEHDAPNVRALVPQALLLAHVRAIELHVVGQLARATDARLEGLTAIVVAVAAVGFEKMATVLRERQDALTATEVGELDESFVSQVPQIWLVRIGFVTRFSEVTVGYDPKRPDGRQRAAVVAVQLVPVMAVEHELTLWATRQLNIANENVPWIDVWLAFAWIAVTVAGVLVATK